MPQVAGTLGLMPQIDGTCLTCGGNGQEGPARAAKTGRFGVRRSKLLTSIMFHYPSQRNDGCNLLGPDPADPIKIFLAVIRRSSLLVSDGDRTCVIGDRRVRWRL